MSDTDPKREQPSEDASEPAEQPTEDSGEETIVVSPDEDLEHWIGLTDDGPDQILEVEIPNFDE